MKAYVYTHHGENGKVSELGIALVKNNEELFWLLDQFSDPYCYQFRKAVAGDALSCGVMACEEDDDSTLLVKSNDPTRGETIAEETGFLGGRAWRRFVYPHDNKYKTIVTQ